MTEEKNESEIQEDTVVEETVEVLEPETVEEATAEKTEADAPAEDAEVAEDAPEIIEEAAPEEEPVQLQLLRMKADFDNFRKRTQRERSEWIVRANEDLFLEILPVLDHYAMGLASAEKLGTEASVIEGFRMVYNQLVDMLKKHNVTPIETAGVAFNPHQHEALTHMPSDLPAETIAQEVRRGYMLGDKLLRAAQVVVSSGPVETKDAD